MASSYDYAHNPTAQGNFESWQQIINLYSLEQPGNAQNAPAIPQPETGILIQKQPLTPQQGSAFKPQQDTNPQAPQVEQGATQAEIQMSQPMHDPTSSDEDAGLAPWFGWIATIVIVVFLAWKFFKRSDG